MKRQTKNKKKCKTLLLPIFFFLFLFHAILTFAFDVDFFDSWDESGSQFDQIVWVDSGCPLDDYGIIFGVIDTTFPVWGYCVNNDRSIDSDMDFCIVKNATRNNNCSSSMPLTPVNSEQIPDDWNEANNVNPFQDVLCGEAGNVYSNNTQQIRRGQTEYYCGTPGTPQCHLCGTTANIATYDYYLIDEVFHRCENNGDNHYDTRGQFSGIGHILIETTLCTTGSVCDSAHDDDSSFNPVVIPNNPCKLEEGEECNIIEDCWNNEDCNGAKINYRGLCDEQLIDIHELDYPDGCGDIDAPPVIDTGFNPDQSCELDGGFPNGFRCDETLDNVIEDTQIDVFNAVCKGGLGNSCVDNSDCYHDFDCSGGFCGYGVTAFYTDDISPNIINKSDTITFDNSLSFASDNNIQFACWKIDGVNTECDGNSTQCTSECVGGGFDSSDYEEGFINTFSSGGNFVINLFLGSSGKYNDLHSDSYCISGDGTFCYSCNDGFKNDDETSVDWGGHCGTPFFIRCNNGVLDNITNETSIDYGGNCGNCDNSSLAKDELLNFLIQSNLIIYPFNSSQCVTSQVIRDGTALFVFLLALILIVPIIIILVLMILLISSLGFFGTAFLTSFLIDFLEKRIKNERIKKVLRTIQKIRSIKK